MSKDLNDIAYWIAIAHLPKWRMKTKNKLIAAIFVDRKSTLQEFFRSGVGDWMKQYPLLNEKHIRDLERLKSDMANYAFLAEELISEGYEVLPITDEQYSKTLKKNLKWYAPTVLYLKGNKALLQQDSIAVVGSRKASKVALQFTEKTAKQAVEQDKVVVSGYAKGVDRQALESALEQEGKSIIVLPQGIRTFKSGYRKNYAAISRGDVLVVSTFHPNSKWSVGLAMARNTTIYALADEIYVAESSSKGGTWEGVQDGLKRGRDIFIRQPAPNEKNANQLLIDMGAIPINFDGEINHYGEKAVEEEVKTYKSSAQRNGRKDRDTKIIELLKNEKLTSKEIVRHLQLDWTTNKMTSYLKKMDGVVVLREYKPFKFYIKSDNPTKELF